jgi:hypothetical protein
MRLATLVVFAWILFLTSCRREFTNRNLELIRIGMAPKEVETLLGEPDRIEKGDQGLQERPEKPEVETEPERKNATIRYYYDQDGQTIVFQFQNGHLASEPGRLKEH